MAKRTRRSNSYKRQMANRPHPSEDKETLKDEQVSNPYGLDGDFEDEDELGYDTCNINASADEQEEWAMRMSKLPGRKITVKWKGEDIPINELSSRMARDAALKNKN